MIDIKLKLRLHHLLVDRCHDDLKQEGRDLYNLIIHVLESEWKPINKKIESTIQEVDQVLQIHEKRSQQGMSQKGSNIIVELTKS